MLQFFFYIQCGQVLIFYVNSYVFEMLSFFYEYNLCFVCSLLYHKSCGCIESIYILLSEIINITGIVEFTQAGTFHSCVTSYDNRQSCMSLFNCFLHLCFKPLAFVVIEP